MRRTRPALAVFATVLLATAAHAEYATPGLGVNWTLDNLVANSGGAVTGGDGQYEFHDSVLISATDRITVGAGATLTFLDTTGVLGIEVHGALVAVGTADAPILFTSQDPTPGAWRGLDYNDTAGGSDFHLAWCEVAHADIAVDVFGADILLEDCDVHDSLDKALDFSSAGGSVLRCTLRDNQQRTVVMTLTSSPLFEDCHLENNNIVNSSPYPYFNIGLQGVNSPTIRRCRIIGSGHHMSGGIAIWNASNAVIEENWIEGCGYGILCYQTGANPTIHANVIWANNIHPDTLNWGFGVACNGNNAPILTENLIREHWYGVAAINGGQPNLGDLVNDFPGDDGGNSLVKNELDGQVYGFFNNTPLAQMAQNNNWYAWSEEEVRDAIQDQEDDPSLGPVNYEEWWFDSLGVDDVPGAGVIAAVGAHPNPFNPRVQVTLTTRRASHAAVTVVDVAGRLLCELHVGDLDADEHVFTWDGTDRAGRPLASGTYFYRVVAGAESAAGKLVLVR